mmetsp:Transcript_47399/g.120042  ORF Transcript_47399/g.120042 Transcript_47399/m.120042 type:complete len:225 (-) Transcript_47399:44-718(-)
MPRSVGDDEIRGTLWRALRRCDAGPAVPRAGALPPGSGRLLDEVVSAAESCLVTRANAVEERHVECRRGLRFGRVPCVGANLEAGLEAADGGVAGVGVAQGYGPGEVATSRLHVRNTDPRRPDADRGLCSHLYAAPGLHGHCSTVLLALPGERPTAVRARARGPLPLLHPAAGRLAPRHALLGRTQALRGEDCRPFGCGGVGRRHEGRKRCLEEQAAAVGSVVV